LPAEPDGSTVQVPLPHELHAPVQAVLQQTPSTQFPDPHWLLWVQPVPLPYLQSRSWPLAQLAVHGVQPDGQNPSAVVPLHGRGVVVQTNVHAATVPERVRMLLPSLTHASYCVWQAEGGSHFSPASTTEFPHTAVQLLSVLALQVGGQQPSPLMHVLMSVVLTHFAVHIAAVP
jgi:hypothetical protein